jgi:hypothetical protein
MMVSRGFLPLCIVAIFLAQASAFASQDWTDLCEPDAFAIRQALLDFPSDRFDRSSCADSVYHRGTCEVRPKVSSAPTRDQEMAFVVKLRNNAGMVRNYEVSMAMDPSSAHHETACIVRQIRRVR